MELFNASINKHVLLFMSIFVFSLTAQSQKNKITIDYSDYKTSCGVEISDNGDLITAKWTHGSKTNFVSFRVRPLKKITWMNPQKPLIKSVGVIEDGKMIELFENLQPEYALFLGERSLEKRDGWQVFFDYPYLRSYDIQKSILDTKKVKVSSTGHRATISFVGFKAGEFQGDLNFTFYNNGALMKMEAAMSTNENPRAYLYHAGFSTLENNVENIVWQNTQDEIEKQLANDDFATPKRTRFRAVIAETELGSMATFPSPHRFLPPLDGVGNYGYNWSGQNYLDLFNGYGWGVRQPVFGDKRQVPWISAPPTTIQKMDMFLYFDNKKADAVLNEVKKYTHNDQFVDVPGYKKMTSHFHVEHTLNLVDKQKELNTTAIPDDFVNPEFVQFFKKMGVDIVHLGEFHTGGTPKLTREKRLPLLKLMNSECERLSTDDFLLLPGEEANVHLGGHWMALFPKPVYWVLNNKEEKPFVEDVKGYGKVYHVSSQDDILKLFEKENGLIWVAHGRIKGSAGYPDKYMDQDFYKSDRYLGGGWKNMPVDLSDDKIGSRVFTLLDNMNDWGHKKYVLGEVDVFDIENDYELYGAMNINYVKLGKLPRFKEGWKPILETLSSGNIIVSTGEIVLKNFTVNSVESGGVLKLRNAKRVELKAELSWTFPLRVIEIITSDGKSIDRLKIDLSKTDAFGSKEFVKELNLNGKKWVRMEVWDVAGNVTFTQPISIE
ncbi:hypothetical protein FPF71_08065 [Algibacter amylolyticus]|uniref:Uncharacterized protein n=1 Tax=Algibacter amylolyticus TaxID=1608400 RepID=A0A5M7BCP1_9FLAO|nr:hypothetical protein [Algibacter amylolyticus]KAA5825141.1 hypothetical protein F2B50_08065 [Algibacter amylolyticus]MBB5268751.1 hypothetical protein [Algibacter amylolyticus]TSJ77635.1 hypothetical protein FPF71_08065 [Algibacter amylolyticus]